MHRYILAQSAHLYKGSTETEFESNYHSDLDQCNFSHFAAVNLGILMTIYCLALKVHMMSGEGFGMVDNFSGGVCRNSRAGSGILFCESDGRFDGADILFVGYSQIQTTDNCQ